MTPLELVVFDMAGTTLQAGDLIPTAFRDAFQGEGFTLSDEEILAIRGRSKREAIATLLRERGVSEELPARADAVYERFQRMLIERYEAEGVAPINGATETFQWLRERQVKIALSTGFDRRLAETLVRLVNWESEVDAVVTNDDVPRGRPAPYLLFRAMERTGCERVAAVAAVGDTVSDLRAAANAGVGWSVGVLSGAHSADRLAAEPSDAVIESVRELPGLLAELGCV